jgi:hypothetical protein
MRASDDNPYTISEMICRRFIYVHRHREVASFVHICSYQKHHLYMKKCVLENIYKFSTLIISRKVYGRGYFAPIDQLFCPPSNDRNF